jgi:DNA-binding CsgD family transcriptional regulator
MTATTIDPRIRAEIDVRGPDDCWPWTGRIDHRGYALFGDNVRVSRAILGLSKGDGLVARHKCDNPPCCNPNHLEPGTYQDNMDDMWSRGRGQRGDERAHSKLTPDAVHAIRADQRSASKIAPEFGVSADLVARIKRGEAWTHVPLEGGVVPLTRHRYDDLSERQLAVLRGMADGLTNREIGDLIGVAAGTVSTQSRRMFRKLGVKARGQAVAVGYERGLLGQAVA